MAFGSASGNAGTLSGNRGVGTFGRLRLQLHLPEPKAEARQAFGSIKRPKAEGQRSTGSCGTSVLRQAAQVERRDPMAISPSVDFRGGPCCDLVTIKETAIPTTPNQSGPPRPNPEAKPSASASLCSI